MRSPEVRKKIAEATRQAMRRPEVAERHRNGCKNRIVSAEGRKKQSEAQKRRFKWDRPAIAIRPEVGAKVSRTMMGRKLSESHKDSVRNGVRKYMESLTVVERKERFGAKNLGRISWNRGSTVSGEMRKRISLSLSKAYVEGRMPVLDMHALYAGANGEIWMRSSWEVKVAKWLDENQITWRYQPGFFKTSGGYYVPDFILPELGRYLEVKGWLKDSAAKKMDDFVASGNVLCIVDKTNIDQISLSKEWVQRQMCEASPARQGA
jgi:hypothetical protein